MKIGNEKEVSNLYFKHNGKKLNFSCCKPFEFRDDQISRETSTVCFEFDDILEIHYLISMLDKFKRMCERDIGEWDISKIRG